MHVDDTAGLPLCVVHPAWADRVLFPRKKGNPQKTMAAFLLLFFVIIIAATRKNTGRETPINGALRCIIKEAAHKARNHEETVNANFGKTTLVEH